MNLSKDTHPIEHRWEAGFHGSHHRRSKQWTSDLVLDQLRQWIRAARKPISRNSERRSRIQSIVDGNDSNVTAEYTYLGARNAVRLDFGDADVMLDLWGGTSGQFDGIDRFGRIIDQRWQSYSGTPTDLDRYQYGYDRNSNRLWKQNLVATSGFDEQYTMDAISRLTQMKRGTLDGGHVITGTPGRQQDWTLDPVGNWPGYVTATSGTTDLDQSRTSSTVNEITAIGTNTGGLPVWATPGYDAAGNMTAFLNPSSPTANLTAIYDAWNRLVAVKDGSDFVTQYAYDGLKRRVVKKSYTGGVLQETRDFYFSDQWQVLSEAVSGTTDNAYALGLRYVDELLWRVDGASARQYAMQDANFNCTAICDDTGSVLERYQFDPYGNRTVLNASWTVIGSSAYAWVVGHQGLMLEVDAGLYNCRNRVYLPLLGCWMQRDPAGYVNGMNLYGYLMSMPLVRLDPSGLSVKRGGQHRFRGGRPCKGDPAYCRAWARRVCYSMNLPIMPCREQCIADVGKACNDGSASEYNKAISDASACRARYWFGVRYPGVLPVPAFVFGEEFWPCMKDCLLHDYPRPIGPVVQACITLYFACLNFPNPWDCGAAIGCAALLVPYLYYCRRRCDKYNDVHVG